METGWYSDAIAAAKITDPEKRALKEKNLYDKIRKNFIETDDTIAET